MLNDLLSAVAEHEASGSVRCDRSLGIQKMPEGYALMLNPDHSHFYWLRWDGAESAIHWSMWPIYRGARLNAADNTAINGEIREHEVSTKRRHVRQLPTIP